MNPSIITTEHAKELLDAQAHILNHIFGFLNSMSLKCALELGIADAIHKQGKPMCVAELTKSLDIHPSKIPSFYRLMRHLCHSNFFSKKLINGESVYGLTTNSRLLLKDHPLTQTPLALSLLGETLTNPAHFFSKWFTSDEISPFHVAHGRSVWEYASLEGSFNECFNEAMACDARFVSSLMDASNVSKDLFDGVESLVDVGGGNGTMVKAIAKRYPGMRCIVLDLPHVVEALRENNGENLVYIGGDMFEAIPNADAVLLKWILHDWSDEDCIKLLKLCKKAIPSKDDGGKVLIIDAVIKNEIIDTSNYQGTQILLDMEMMNATVGGKERTEEEWEKLFMDAGFRAYKIYSMLGLRSIIEVYP